MDKFIKFHKQRDDPNLKTGNVLTTKEMLDFLEKTQAAQIQEEEER